MTEHHATLSPSRFPAYAKCIHYEPLPLDSESRKRGIKIHSYAARFLSDEPIGSVSQEDIEAAGLGEKIARQVRETLTEIKGIEYRVNIMDYMQVPPERITFGTADAWGYDGTHLTLIDAKSGKERDYKEQMACYALGLMDEQREQECKCVVLYCDKPAREIYKFSIKEAEQIVFGIIARVNAGVEEPQENSFCPFCAKRPTCPVWTVGAEQALAKLAEKHFDLESLKQDPIKLGDFLDKWRKARKLVEDAELEKCAKALLTADPESVPGWKVSTVNGRLSYSEDEVMDILELEDKLGTQRLVSFLSVNREKFEEAWKEVSKLPVPVEPSIHAGTYQKLIRK